MTSTSKTSTNEKPWVFFAEAINLFLMLNNSRAIVLMLCG